MPFPHRMRISLSAAALALSAALLAGCDDPANPGPDYPPRGEIVSPDPQQGPVGQPLPQPISVRVTDQDGEPIAGQTVTFAVTAGGGSVFAATAQTNASGIASNQWTLGTVAGDTQRVEARMIDPESGGPVVLATFRAVGLPGAAAAITALPPAARTGGAGQALADSLRARVTDANGNGLAGVTVAWNVAAGGGTIQPATTTTDAQGIARASWTLGTQLGAPQTAEASLSPAVRAQFTATTTLPLGTTLVKVGGDGQSAVAGTPLGGPVTVEVRTPGGQVIGGVPVTFTPAAGSGTVTPPAAQTGLDGRAWAAWTLGTTAGPQQLIAAAEGMAPVTFGATANAGAAATFTIVGGNGQTGAVHAALAAPLAVRVLDANGNPVPGALIVWNVLDGSGAVIPTQSQTDAAGIAQTEWTLGGALGPQSAEASLSPAVRVAFTASAQLPPGATLVKVSGDGQTGTVAAPLGSPVVVEARTAGGQPVSGVTVAWTPAAGSGSVAPATAQTGADGRASATWTLGTAAGAQTLTASAEGMDAVTFGATARAGAATSFTIVNGNGQTAPAGSSLPQALAVQLMDAYGNAVRAFVTWTVTSGGGSAVPTQSQVNASGRATTQWTLGPTVGTQTLTASTAGLELNFAATAVPGPIATVEVTPPSVTLALRGDTAHLTARAADAYGNPVPTTFTWSSTDAAIASVSPSGVVTALAAGTAQIRATAGGRSDTAFVTVTQTVEPLAQVSASPMCMVGVSGRLYCMAFPNRVRTQLPGSPAFDTLASRIDHLCGLTASGATWCWGGNANSSIGYNGAPPQDDCSTTWPGDDCNRVPRQVPGAPPFERITVGTGHMCGLTGDGTAYCWGSNNYGQRGATGGFTATPAPVDGGLKFRAIAASASHTCAVALTGQTYCWGTLSGVRNNAPTLVAGAPPLVEIVAGGALVQTAFSCGLTAAGQAWCWGDNSDAQLGIGTFVDSPAPAAVQQGALAFTRLTAGNAHTCALTAAGQAYCWGRNDEGQAGIVTGTQPRTPAAVLGGLAFSRISAGPRNTVALTPDGRLYCWGESPFCTSHAGPIPESLP